MDKDTLSIVIPTIGTLVGGLISTWFGLRIVRLQTNSQNKTSLDSLESVEEIEFRKSLLELIEKQEQKLQHQDEKLEKLEVQAEANRSLIDDLKRANLTLTIENQHLKRRILEQEVEVSALRKKVEPLIRSDA